MKLTRVLATGYVWTIIAFLILPIAVVIPMSFSQAAFLRFPPVDLGFLWYGKYFSDPQWIDATFLSLKIATGSSVIACAVGTLAALSLERTRATFKRSVTSILSLPIVVPSIFIALGVFLVALRFDLLDSELLVIAAHATLSLPFVVLMVGAVVRQLDVSLERAARIMGAGPVRAFFSVTFPALVPSLAAAFVVSFFLSFDELIVSLFTLSGKETLPMLLWNNMRLDVSPIITAVASLLIMATIVFMLGAEVLRRRSTASLASGNSEDA